MFCTACGSTTTSKGPSAIVYCEDCALTYRGAPLRVEIDLVSVSTSLGLTPLALSLTHEPSAKSYDFFLSYHPKDAEAAAAVTETLCEAGYTILLPAGGPDFLAEIHNGLRN